MYRRIPVLVAVAAAALLAARAAAPSPAALDPVRMVDPFIGTGGNGHTFPGADVPFGMVQFSPVTVGGGPGGYSYSASRISGFALTRLSGAGCTNYGDVPLMPVAAPPQASPAAAPWEFTAGFSHSDESAHPGSYGVGLGSGISVELAATTRTGIARIAYPASATDGTLLVEPSASANGRSSLVHVIGRTEVVGSALSSAFGGACGHPRGSYRIYFAIVFNRPFAGFGTWSGRSLSPAVRQEAGPQVGAYVTFATRAGPPVVAKAGISFVSVADASRNLAAEASSWSVAATAARAEARWRQLLDRIRLSGGSPRQETDFYTALYHALLEPSVFSDVGGQYVGEDGRVHVARGYVQYANFSGWDIYRGEVQLLALLDPGTASAMIRSLLADARQAGQLPRWPVANVDTGLMVGDPADAIIADAYAFGARGYDARLALREMLAGAGVTGRPSLRRAASGAVPAERPGADAYLSRGYIPAEAAATLEYALDDFAISRVAGALGDRTDAQLLLTRSGNWRQTFDERTGFVEPRLGDGAFPRRLSPTSSTGFVEGDAWQYTFMVPQDTHGLLAALGSPSLARRRLDAFFARLNAGPNAPHAWLGNEPSLGAPYTYLWLGMPARSEAVVHRALTTLFTAAPGGLPGNDDLGTLSAWYVWSSLGLYPAIPGVAGLALVAPLFPEATITLGDGRTLDLRSSGAGPGDGVGYIRSLRLDGRPYPSTWLPLARVAGGGTLEYARGSRPSAWGSAAVARPPSFAG